jgi:non-specific serine/threonine protein kinase
VAVHRKCSLWTRGDEFVESDRAAARAKSVIARHPAGVFEHDYALSATPTALVGRETDLVRASRLIGQSSVRLFTVTGPGGTGKTRFAIALATELTPSYDLGAVFVDLTPLNEPALVLPEIGLALGVRESAARSIAAGIRRRLASRSLVLVVDNFEHMLPAASDIGTLLHAAPGLDIIATSREPLRLRWEHEFPLPPLAVPGVDCDASSIGALVALPSVDLLVQRAQAVRPSFALTLENAAAIAELCRRLDGLPLAIELAAARLKVLSPVALLARLERRLDLLAVSSPDVPERHRTLRAAIEWSHGLLARREQELFARLAVFSGDFTAAAAWAVCSIAGDMDRMTVLDDLTSLVDKSLLSVADGHDGEPRFRMLETVADYARDRLAEAGDADARDAHAAHFQRFLEECEPHVFGPGQAEWRIRMMAEQDNVRAAFQWSLATGNLEVAGRILRRAFFPWWTQGHLREVRRWALGYLGVCWLGCLEAHPSTVAIARYAAGFAELEQGNDDAARAHFTIALELHSRGNDSLGIAASLMGLAFLCPAEGKVAQGIAMLADAVERLGAGNWTWYRAFALVGLSAMTQLAGDLEAAQEYADRSLALAEELGDSWSLGQAHDQLAVMALLRGDPGGAIAIVRQSLPACLAAGQSEIVAYGIKVLAMASTDPVRAARLFGAADALRDAIGVAIWPSRRAMYDVRQAAVADRIGTEAYAVAWNEGRMLSAAEAVALGLEDADSPAASGSSPLTRRQREIAALIASGLTSREIGDRLHVSERTVDAHADHIRTRLELRSRAEIAAWAIREGGGE